jgi:hypothetical protein
MSNELIIHTNLHKPNNKLVNAWLEHFWCTNEPRAYTDLQNSSWPGLGEATTFPLAILFVISHRGCIQMSFCLRIPKIGKFEILKIKTLNILEDHKFLCKPLIKVKSKAKLQSLSKVFQ